MVLELTTTSQITLGHQYLIVAPRGAILTCLNMSKLQRIPFSYKSQAVS